LVNRNALTEFLGQAQASGILGRGSHSGWQSNRSGVWGDLMLSLLASGVPPGGEIHRRPRDALEEFLNLYGKLASDAG
jgi:hypothetical protein